MENERAQDELDKAIPEDLKKLALSAKTIPLDDPRVQEHLSGNIQGHKQYRNNYVGIFEGLSILIRTGKVEKNSFFGIYLHKLTASGVDPQQFYENNKGFCEELFNALYGQNEYDNLMMGFRDFYRKHMFDVGDRLNEIVPHPIGIEAVGMYAWDRINPLLEKADNILKGMGIDTKDFGV